MSNRPSLDLVVVVTDKTGTTTTLDSNAKDPGDRPRGIQFGTQLGSGFYTGGFTLSRRIDRDNVDLHLLDDARIIGAAGDTAYEGFVGAMPRSMDDTHTLNIATTGYMAAASDQSFTCIFVDQDISRWGAPSRTRYAGLIGAGLKVFDSATHPDVTTGKASLSTFVGDDWGAGGATSEPWYDAGPGNLIGAIEGVFQTSGSAFGAFPGFWGWQIFVAADDTAATTGTSNLAAASGAGSIVPATPARYGLLSFVYSAAGGTAGLTWSVDWTRLTVYGDHGLPLIDPGDGSPRGVGASDVIRYLAGKYCPLLNTAGVQSTTYPIAQLAFYEDSSVYDAMLKVNSYHLWNLAVWEGRTLTYAPIDLSDYDWQIRHDEVGATIGLQGDDAAALRNGIIVTFQNVATGKLERLHPDVYAELRDDSIDNPANQHGRKMFGTQPFMIPFPTTRADALILGQLQLREDQQPKAPGSFTVANHIQDRQGNWQPVWMVRAGHRIKPVSSVMLSDRPRLIHETSYNHDSRTVTIAVDSTLRYIEGYIDRVSTALAANGLSG